MYISDFSLFKFINAPPQRLNTFFKHRYSFGKTVMPVDLFLKLRNPVIGQLSRSDYSAECADSRADKRNYSCN